MKIIVTGVEGQDGYYMCEYILTNTNHFVYGTTYKSCKPLFKSCNYTQINLNLEDKKEISTIIQEILPDQFYHFAGKTDVRTSYSLCSDIFSTNILGYSNILMSIKKYCSECKVFCPGSSEEFGIPIYSPQDFNHPTLPCNSYGISKLSMRHISRVFREKHRLNIVYAILFIHESCRRPERFVASKIVKTLKRIKNGSEEILKIGNIYTKRDWSWAPDIINTIYTHMQKENKDIILGSGVVHTIKDWIDQTCLNLNMKVVWEGNKSIEMKLWSNDYNKYIVEVSDEFYNKENNIPFIADSDYKLPTSFENMIKYMCDHINEN